MYRAISEEIFLCFGGFETNKRSVNKRATRKKINMDHHPFKIFSIWILENVFAILVSFHLNFDMNDFRVWSLWCLSMSLGIIQIFMHRKSLKQNFKEWISETFKKKQP